MRLDPAAGDHHLTGRHPPGDDFGPAPATRQSASPSEEIAGTGHPVSHPGICGRLRLFQCHSRPGPSTGAQRVVLRPAATDRGRTRRHFRTGLGSAATAGSDSRLVRTTGRIRPAPPGPLLRLAPKPLVRTGSKPDSRLWTDGVTGFPRIRDCLAVPRDRWPTTDSSELVQCAVRTDRTAGPGTAVTLGSLAFRMDAPGLFTGVVGSSAGPRLDVAPRYRRIAANRIATAIPVGRASGVHLAGGGGGSGDGHSTGEPDLRWSTGLGSHMAGRTPPGADPGSCRPQLDTDSGHRGLGRHHRRLAVATSASRPADGPLTSRTAGQPLAGTLADLDSADHGPCRIRTFDRGPAHRPVPLASAPSRFAHCPPGRTASSGINIPVQAPATQPDRRAENRRLATDLAAFRSTCRLDGRTAVLVGIPRIDAQ